MTASNQIETRKGDGRTEEFVKYDLLDEEQIAEEIRGAVIEQYFYEFQQFDPLVKKTVTKVGLAFSGVKWIAARMRDQKHPLSIIHAEVNPSPDGESWLAVAIAQDTATGEKRFGNAEQSRWIDKYRWEKGVKTEEIVGRDPRPFAYTLALSKAQRNALRMFMDETIIQEGYKAWKAAKAKPAEPARPSELPQPAEPKGTGAKSTQVWPPVEQASTG